MFKRYGTDVCDAAWAIIEPHLPAAKPGGRPRSTDPRAVINAIFYLLRTGCQWRLLPRCFPQWSTVHHYFRAWDRAGVWTRLHRTVYRLARVAAGRDMHRQLLPMHQSPRCGARTRRGSPCRSPAVRGRRRCRMHGGAPGSGAQPGNGNALKHGRHTSEMLEFRRMVRELVREVRELIEIV